LEEIVPNVDIVLVSLFLWTRGKDSSCDSWLSHVRFLFKEEGCLRKRLQKRWRRRRKAIKQGEEIEVERDLGYIVYLPSLMYS